MVAKLWLFPSECPGGTTKGGPNSEISGGSSGLWYLGGFKSAISDGTSGRLGGGYEFGSPLLVCSGDALGLGALAGSAILLHGAESGGILVHHDPAPFHTSAPLNTSPAIFFRLC